MKVFISSAIARIPPDSKTVPPFVHLHKGLAPPARNLNSSA